MTQTPDPHEDATPTLTPTTGSANGSGPIVPPFDPPPIVDPWDPDYLAVSSETLAHAVRTILPVKKPSSTGWFRASDNPAHAIQLLLYRDTGDDNLDGLYYLVREEVKSLLADVSRVHLVALCRGLRSGPFFWPIPLPSDGREPSIWTTSALRQLDAARRGWIRRTTSTEDGYQFLVPDEPDALPPAASFPQEPMRELLLLAFRDTNLDSVNHPLIAKIRGRKVRKP